MNFEATITKISSKSEKVVGYGVQLAKPKIEKNSFKANQENAPEIFPKQQMIYIEPINKFFISDLKLIKNISLFKIENEPGQSLTRSGPVLYSYENDITSKKSVNLSRKSDNSYNKLRSDSSLEKNENNQGNKSLANEEEKEEENKSE